MSSLLLLSPPLIQCDLFFFAYLFSVHSMSSLLPSFHVISSSSLFSSHSMSSLLLLPSFPIISSLLSSFSPTLCHSPTASPGQARDLIYFIHTNNSRADDVTVLYEREKGGKRKREGKRVRGKENR